MTVGVLCLFLTMPWVGLECVIFVFPCHTQLLFYFLKFLVNTFQLVTYASVKFNCLTERFMFTFSMLKRNIADHTIFC